jgi:hypothetical protein
MCARWPAAQSARFLRALTALAALSLAAPAAFALAGCGGRTGLLVEQAPPPPGKDAGAPVFPILALVPSPASGEGTYDYAFSPFDPETGTFADLEPIPCLAAIGDRPLSMAIDCGGAAYIQFAQSGLWRVTSSASDCGPTRFDAAAQRVLPDLALSFVAGAAGGESLYFVATDTSLVPPSPELGVVDTSTFAVKRVAPFAQGQPHLAGAPDGRLFAMVGNAIDQVDPSAGNLTLLYQLPASAGPAQAFAFWHGSFYVFRILSNDSTSVVRFTPGEASIANAGKSNWMVLAAAASLCQ